MSSPTVPPPAPPRASLRIRIRNNSNKQLTFAWHVEHDGPGVKTIRIHYADIGFEFRVQDIALDNFQLSQFY
jgi:hypothetical protein